MGVVGPLISFILALFASINVGLTWFTLNSNDVCEGNMYKYMYGIGIYSIIVLSIYLIIMIMSIFKDEIMFALIPVIVISSILNGVWFIWGIILLANQECLGTIYNTMTIVIVVLSGLGFTNICFASSDSE